MTDYEALAKELRSWVAQSHHDWSGASLVNRAAAALERVPKLVAALREIGDGYVSLNPGNHDQTLRELSRLKGRARAALEDIDE